MSARKKEALTNIRSIQELASAATAANPGGALRHQAIVVAEASAALGRKDISFNDFTRETGLNPQDPPDQRIIVPQPD